MSSNTERYRCRRGRAARPSVGGVYTSIIGYSLDLLEPGSAAVTARPLYTAVDPSPRALCPRVPASVRSVHT